MNYIIVRAFGKYTVLTEGSWYARLAYPMPAWTEYKECKLAEKTFKNLVKFGPSVAAQALLKTIWQES